MSNDHGLSIFRRVPENISSLDPLLSSFQSFEASLELMALRRYPAAVIVCANAWESAIKAYFRMGPKDNPGLLALINEISKKFGFPEKVVKDAHSFRRVRNDLAHFGASPADDQRSFDLLLSTGYAFYSKLIRECFGCYLNWREVAPGVGSFEEMVLAQGLGAQEVKCLLIPMFGDALFDSLALHKEFGSSKLISNNRFCAARLVYLFGGLIEWGFVGARRRFAEEFTDEYIDYLQSVRSKVEDSFDGWFYEFDCPVCGDHNFVAEIDESRSTKKSISLDRGRCIECDFGIGVGNKGVLNRLLRDQIKEKLPEIVDRFKEYL